MEHDELVRLLILAALFASTLEYYVIIRRRHAARTRAAELQLVQETGLRGLVRVFLAPE